MFYNNRMRNMNNQPLVKIKSSYDKLEKVLNEPAREYNAIKELVENQENNITNIKNIRNKNKEITLLPKQKIKTKNNDLENKSSKINLFKFLDFIQKLKYIF